MSGGRIVTVVIGSLLVLIGLAVAAGGGVLLWADTTQRDADGFFTSSSVALATPGHALVSDELDLGTDVDADWAEEIGDLVRTRLTVDRGAAAPPTFVGIAPQAEVRAYLRGVAHSRVVDIGTDPVRADYVVVPGSRAPAPPASRQIWDAQAQGTGRQALEWTPRPGEWTVVAMNADGSRGVALEAEAGIRVDMLGRIAAGLLVGGLVLLALGTLLMVLGFRRRGGPGAAPPPGGIEDVTAGADPPR